MKIEDARVGMEVVCLDDDEFLLSGAKIKKGDVLEIRGATTAGNIILNKPGYSPFWTCDPLAFEPVPFPRRHRGHCMTVKIDLTYVEQAIKEAKQKMANMSKPQIDRVIFSDPATVVFWKDGTKTVAKCEQGDTFSEWVGLAICHFKKAYSGEHDRNYIERVIKRAVRK